MNRKPYSSYHGRKSWMQRILTAIAVVLAVALLLALVALFVLPNYAIYNGDKIQFDLPFFRGGDRRDPVYKSGEDVEEPIFIIESAAPSAAPSASAPDLTDLPPRRTAPLGLVVYAEDKTLAARQGFLFTADQVSDFTRETCREDFNYVAVYVDAQDLEQEELETWCMTLASQGVDEIVVDGQVDVKALREALPADVYHGYLSAVAEKAPFQNNTQQGRDLAKYCDRLYVPGGNWNGLNLYSYLKSHDFVGTSADIVTVVTAPTSANWAWAVLPE